MVNLNRKYYPLTKTKKGKSILITLDSKTKKNLSKAQNKEIDARLNTTYIPKHLHNIYIAKSPKNKVQIIGQDDNERMQYFYNKSYADKSESRKYKSLSDLGKVIYTLEKDNSRDIKLLYKQLKKDKSYILKKQDAMNLVLYFLLYHHNRIGSKQYLEQYGSTGISTLKCSHFNINGNVCHIKFKGKKNVLNNSYIQFMGNDNISRINDTLPSLDNNNNNNNHNNHNNHNNIHSRISQTNSTDIHSYMLQIVKLLKSRKSANDFIFDYEFENPISNTKGTSIISTTDFKDYYQSKYNVEITPKMFRTWFANYYLIYYINTLSNNILSEIKKAKTKTDSRNIISKYRNGVLQYVSTNLNNTPAICKKKYINNKFLEEIFNNLRYQTSKINKSISGSNNTNNNKSYPITRKKIHNYIIKNLL